MTGQEKIHALDECIFDMELTNRKIAHVSKILSGVDFGDREIRKLVLADVEVHEVFLKYEKLAKKVEGDFLECLQNILEIKQKYLKEGSNI